ncbi:hypothetical protein BZG36_00401 [Bifiguratus adelaidae]|uniref:Major facilitator superfamily (MFS) profile domain-containing protein n=1 Tax=Bifiguratus adelaidae TaxID=1938954 RepID=A0A261Y7Y6_9FUNG|nr:hypothetical protein BZG36_00401 [Bifiguratus adelaidae]
MSQGSSSDTIPAYDVEQGPNNLVSLDDIGRSKIYGFELLIIILATLCSAMAGSAAVGVGAVGFLGFWRLILGIGWGQLAGALADIILLAIFKGPVTASQYNLDYVWRILAALGCVPACTTIYYRFALPESPIYAKNVMKDDDAARAGLKYVDKPVSRLTNVEVAETAKKPAHFKAFWAHFSQWKYGKVLFGTSMSWFLLDIAFYGITLNQSVVLTAIGFAPKGLSPWDTLFKQGLGNLIVVLLGALPGYYATVFLVEKMGRKTIQLIGFAVDTILFVIVAAAYKPLVAQAMPAFVVLFALIQFFFQFGANATTFIIPAEVFPTRFRASAHGFSAACGKAGAIISAFGFNSLVNVGGTNACLQQTLGIFAAIMALGFCTTLFIPESKGKPLNYFEAEAEAEEL